MASGQLKNSFQSIGEIDYALPPATLTLKLSFTKSYIRYFVVSNTHHRVLYLGEYTLHHITDDTQLAQQFRKLLPKDEVLQLSFGETMVGLDTPYHLIPPDFAFLKKANESLQWCPSSQVNIAFENSETIVPILNELLHKPKILHLTSSLLNRLPEYLGETTDKLFVNVQMEQFDLAAFRQDKSLVLLNRFAFRTDTDFIYFLLRCCDELKINRELTELVLLGEINKQSKIYTMCDKYFKTISFIEAPDNITFSKEFKSFAKHHYFTLYNLSE